jgi:hypothetical protein
VGVSGIAYDATESQKPVNKWMKANKGINKNSSYITFMNFNSYQLPEWCDVREFKFRIRTFNRSQARHGNWTTQTLQVCKRVEVVDETTITASDGGIKVKFNYKGDRATRFQVNSIKDADGRELLRKPYYSPLEVAKLTENTTPKPRSGYSAGMLTIPLSRLKRAISATDTLTAEVKLLTDLEVPTMLWMRNVIDPRRDVPVTLGTSWDEGSGILTVTATNDGTVALANIGCGVSYTYNGKRYAIAPTSKSINLTGTSTFKFLPPIGIELTVTVKEEDAEDYKDVETTKVTPTAKGYRLNKENSPTTCAVLWGAPQWEMDSKQQMETALPYGREKNVAFYGIGDTTSITLTGLVVDKAGTYAEAYSRKKAWDNVRNNQGVYYLRSSRGDMYKVALQSVGISHDKRDLYDLSASMTEVV